MKYFIIGFIVIVALLAWVLSRRGSMGMSSKGSTDTVSGTLGAQAHDRDNTAGGL